MSEWQKSLFEVMVDNNGIPTPRTTAGWVKEPFALDPRYYDSEIEGCLEKGWVITHLPTGHVVRGITGTLKQALIVADKLLAADPWDFVDASAAAKRGPLVKRLMSEHEEIVSPSMFLSGLWLEDAV